MEDSFDPVLDAKHARYFLMEIQMKCNVIAYIQCFCTLMHNVPMMTQDDALLLFMQGLEPKVRE